MGGARNLQCFRTGSKKCHWPFSSFNNCFELECVSRKIEQKAYHELNQNDIRLNTPG